MKVRCRTNLDDWKRYDWPTEMACRPEVGDYVEAKDGHGLRVYSLTHSMTKVSGYDVFPEVWEPILLVELNK